MRNNYIAHVKVCCILIVILWARAVKSRNGEFWNAVKLVYSLPLLLLSQPTLSHLWFIYYHIYFLLHCLSLLLSSLDLSIAPVHSSQSKCGGLTQPGRCATHIVHIPPSPSLSFLYPAPSSHPLASAAIPPHITPAIWCLIPTARCSQPQTSTVSLVEDVAELAGHGCGT